MPSPYVLTSSLLSAADFARLGEQIQEAEASGVDGIHIDVMDGHFVPNISMGPFIVETCRRITNLPLDVHLMIERPERMLEDFIQAGANLLYIHVENNSNLYRTLERVQELGCKAAVVLNPGTPAAAVQAVLHLVNVILVMTVNPGYSGQKFIPQVVPKISLIRQALDKVNPKAMIAVDGGITSSTLPQTLEAGAQIFIAATAIYKHPQGIAAGVQALRDCFPRH
ncbi:MAG: ribulose-phosphate 3-epimerase [Omnitrophica WOR_2 bacterium]